MNEDKKKKNILYTCTKKLLQQNITPKPMMTLSFEKKRYETADTTACKTEGNVGKFLNILRLGKGC